jgi:DNA-binding response OmpR family regulator
MKKILSIEDNSATLNDLKTAIDQCAINSDELKFLSINKDFDKIHSNTILRFNPDLIILDIRLNGKYDSSGLNIARILRSSEKTKHIPIVILSVLAEYQEIAEREKLYDTFLLKPCENDMLLDCVLRLL